MLVITHTGYPLAQIIQIEIQIERLNYIHIMIMSIEHTISIC